MRTKVLNCFLALILFIGVTFFVASCGEDANNNNNGDNQQNQKTVINAQIQVVDNSFTISPAQEVVINFEENTTLNLDKSNFNVTLFYSDGTSQTNFTDYTLTNDIPTPITAGNYNIHISASENGNLYSTTISVFIVKKELTDIVTAISSMTEALKTRYTGEAINAGDLLNARYNNVLAPYTDKVEFVDEYSFVSTATNVGNYTAQLHSKNSNYDFGSYGNAITFSWEIEKREIVATLNSYNFDFAYSIANIAPQGEPEELGIVASPITPTISLAFKDDLSTPLTVSQIDEMLTFDGDLSSTTIGTSRITIALNSAFADNYTFAEDSHSISSMEEEIRVLYVYYSISQITVKKPTIINGDNYHYTFDYDPVIIDALYDGKTLDEYSTYPIEYYLYDFSVNGGYDAVNAGTYYARFSVKQYLWDSGLYYNFIFENTGSSETAIPYDIQYSFTIDKQEFNNNYQLSDFYTVADILDTTDDENYIGKNVVIQTQYQEGLSIYWINAYNCDNFASMNTYYTNDTKTYFTNHGLLNNDSYINFTQETIDYFSFSNLEAGTYDIELVYCHSYNNLYLQNSFMEYYCNFTYITFPAKLIITKQQIVENTDYYPNWYINYDQDNRDIDWLANSSPEYLVYDGLTHAVHLNIADSRINVGNDYKFYYSADNTEFAQVTNIKNAGYYYVTVSISSNDNNYEADETTLQSTTFRINQKSIGTYISFSGTAVGSLIGEPYFSYHTGANKTIEYSIGISGLSTNTIYVTASDLNASHQAVISSLENVHLLYEYSATGASYSELVGDNKDLSQIGYYKLTISFDYDNVNYIVGEYSITEKVCEWMILGLTVDVSAVNWVAQTDFEYTGNTEYPLLANMPIGVYAEYWYADYENNKLTTMSTTSYQTRIGENYAFVQSFKPYNVDGAYDANDQSRVSITGKDASFFGSGLTYNTAYDTDPTQPKYNCTKGKVFNIIKAKVLKSNIAWQYATSNENTYQPISNEMLEIAIPAGSTLDNIYFRISYEEQTWYTPFALAYKYGAGDDDPEPITLVDYIQVPFTAGSYTLQATLTIDENGTTIFDDGQYVIDITLNLTIVNE